MALPRTAGPVQSSIPPGSGGLVSGTSPTGPGFLGSQPQAAIVKQMLLDQRAQLMEQQKQQFLREQRQQVLAEQVTGGRATPIPQRPSSTHHLWAPQACPLSRCSQSSIFLGHGTTCSIYSFPVGPILE